MKYIKVLLTTSHNEKTYLVRPDMIPRFYSEVVQELTNDCKIAFKGRIDVNNEYRNYYATK